MNLIFVLARPAGGEIGEADWAGDEAGGGGAEEGV